MDTPLSILVCVRNRADLTRSFLDTLLPTLDKASAELLVYDDLSTDGTPELLEACAQNEGASLGGGATIVRGESPGCFGSNMNALATRASGERLLLLNNDMLFDEGWLAPLLDAARAQGSGIVGNRQTYPTRERGGDPRTAGLLNHGGGAFAPDLTPVNLYDGLAPDLPAARTNRKLQFVTGACWLIDRALFHDLEGFDPLFRNGFEDADLCLRVQQHGASVFYCGESQIEHFGSSTPGRFSRQHENRSAFQKRWRGTLEPDLEEITRRDGVDWPPHRPLIDAARAIVHAPGVAQVAQKLSTVPALQRAWRRLRG